MSDQAAPPPAATPAPAPAPTPAQEVAVDPNPVAVPQPVGQQAPDAPVGDLKGSEHRPPSRREVIKAAFEKAQRQQALDDKKAAQGQPQAQDEAKKPGKPVADPQPRDKGRFVARNPQPQTGDQGELTTHARPGQQPQAGQPPGQQPQSQAAQAPAPLPDNAPYRDPPPRFSERAKADWAGAPESIRGDIHRMTQEFEGAYRQYRGDHETMETIRPYHQLATQHGTTLDKALSNYVGMEQLLRRDPLQGMDMIVQNLNLRAPDGQPITLRDIAHHIVSQTPEQMQMRQSQNGMMSQSHQMQAVIERMERLEKQQQQGQYSQRFAETRAQVDQFADTHPRFDELSDLIEEELAHGYSLDEAYKRAERLSGLAPQAAQTRTPNTSAQTRSADRSISGAPDAGPSNGTSRKTGKPVGRRESIQRAISRVNGAI